MSITTASRLDPAQLDLLSINTIRFLSIEAVQKANSGHPGLPMGSALSHHFDVNRGLVALKEAVESAL